MFALLLFAAVAVLPPESFTPDARGVFTCDLAKLGVEPEAGEYRSGGWTGVPEYPSLYFGAELMTLAREPDAGWFMFAGEDNVTVTNLPASGYSMGGYWSQDWAFEILRVECVSNGVARFKDRHAFGIGRPSWGRKERRFYAVNHPDFLNAEGEWFLDRGKRTLAFIPPRGDIAAEPIRLVWGRKPVRGLYNENGKVVRGETIAFGGGTGLELRNCRDVLIADCTIECVAGKGIDIGGDCRNVVISNCVIRNVGRAGILLDGGDRKSLTRGGNVVTDCEITDFALLQRVYAPGAWMNGCGNAIRRCRIHAAPHSAILYAGNENLIEGNDIYDVIRETGDAGAIYTGRDWTSQGNVVRGNHIHDLGQSVSNGKSHDVFTMGVYLDDCDCGDRIESNRFVRAGCAVMMGGGRDNAVVGNEMTDCDIGIHLDDRGVTWTKHWNNPDDPSWNLVGKAEALRYREEPWRSRYPHLAAIMDEEPRLPKYNEFRDNVLRNVRIPYQFDTRHAIAAHLALSFCPETNLYYGRGTNDTEDCAILTGVALAAAVDAYDREESARLAKGLLSLATAAGVPGYVCRGIARDGKTVNRGSSRDQITHFVHGLYRYYRSGLADEAMKAEIRGALAAVADRMLANVTPENGWNALDADGKPDAKGVLKMWEVQPHEAMRLPMIYLAAAEATGGEKYREAYEKHVDAALERSWGISKLTDQERKWTMPGYAFLQMNSSLEVIRLGDRSRANRAEAVMKEVALLAARRFVEEKGADGPWLSAAGDLCLAVAMISKVESYENAMGADLAAAYRKLADDCWYGLDGQPAPWETCSPRAISLLGAFLRR